MMPKQRWKPRQERMTYNDVSKSIRLLRKFIRKKIKDNEGIKDEEEFDYFTDLFDFAVLSHGQYRFSFPIKGWGVIPYGNLGNFVSGFAEESIGVKGKHFFLEDKASGTFFKVEFKTIWKMILEKIWYTKTYTQEEALHMSREAPVREEVTGHRVSLEEKTRKS